MLCYVQQACLSHGQTSLKDPQSPECVMSLCGWLTKFGRRGINRRNVTLSWPHDPRFHFDFEFSVHFSDDYLLIVHAVVRAHNDSLTSCITSWSQWELPVGVVVVQMDSVALVLFHRCQFDEISAVADLYVYGSCCAIDDLRGTHLELLGDSAINVDDCAASEAWMVEDDDEIWKNQLKRRLECENG